MLGPMPPLSTSISLVSEFICPSSTWDVEKLAVLLAPEDMWIVLGIPLDRSGTRGWMALALLEAGYIHS